MVERLWGIDSKGHIDVLEEGITVISRSKVWSISHAAGTSIAWCSSFPKDVLTACGCFPML